MRFLFISFCLLSIHGYAQLAIHQINSASAGALQPGEEVFYAGYSWHDTTGEQRLLLSYRKSRGYAEETSDSAWALGIHARHFLYSGSGWACDWQVRDTVPPCDFDLDAGFIPGSTKVTDLNHDGKSEVWLVYMLTCTSDVSPLVMKEIMYENGNKFAIRGKSRVNTGSGKYVGGEFEFDDAFKKGPAVFRSFGRDHWNRFKSYKMEYLFWSIKG